MTGKFFIELTVYLWLGSNPWLSEWEVRPSSGTHGTNISHHSIEMGDREDLLNGKLKFTVFVNSFQAFTTSSYPCLILLSSFLNRLHLIFDRREICMQDQLMVKFECSWRFSRLNHLIVANQSCKSRKQPKVEPLENILTETNWIHWFRNIIQILVFLCLKRALLFML